MKKILLILMIVFAGMICQAQDQQSTTLEDFKESCLHNFYFALLSNPHIAGLPDDYNKFKTALLNPEKSLAFYNIMIADSCLRGVMPTTYQGFLGAYGLDKKSDVNIVFQPSTVNTSDDYNNYKTERQIKLEQELRSVQEQRLDLEREIMEHRYKQERTNSIFDASRLVIDAIGGSMGATIPDYYNQDIWQTEQKDDYIIYRTFPGTTIKDFSKPGLKIENGVAYPTFPGTEIKDFSKPGYKIEKKQ